MGPCGLLSFLGVSELKKAGLAPFGKKSLSGDLKDRRIGLDASIILVKALNRLMDRNAAVLASDLSMVSQDDLADPPEGVIDVIHSTFHEDIDFYKSMGVARMIFVFDGRRPPCKSVPGRQDAREKSYAAAWQMSEEDADENWNVFTKLLRRSLRVTWSMVQCAMEFLSTRKIEYLVAPFEADSQLAQLQRSSAIDVIVTEDGDLAILATGKVLFGGLIRKKTGSKLQCCLYSATAKHSVLSCGNQYSIWCASDLVVFSLLVSCDFTLFCGISREGFGEVTAKKFVNQFVEYRTSKSESDSNNDDPETYSKHLQDFLATRAARAAPAVKFSFFQLLTGLVCFWCSVCWNCPETTRKYTNESWARLYEKIRAAAPNSQAALKSLADIVGAITGLDNASGFQSGFIHPLSGEYLPLNVAANDADMPADRLTARQNILEQCARLDFLIAGKFQPRLSPSQIQPLPPKSYKMGFSRAVSILHTGAAIKVISLRQTALAAATVTLPGVTATVTPNSESGFMFMHAKIPRSMVLSEHFDVYLHLQVLHGAVQRFVFKFCQCQASINEDCCHIGILLWLLHFLGAGTLEATSKTSMTPLWGRPTGIIKVDAVRPLSEYIFEKNRPPPPDSVQSEADSEADDMDNSDDDESDSDHSNRRRRAKGCKQKKNYSLGSKQDMVKKLRIDAGDYKKAILSCGLLQSEWHGIL